MHSRSQHYGNHMGTGILAFLVGALVWALWGDRITKKVRESKDFQRLKSEIERKAYKVRDLTKEKYEQIVDDATANYAKIKDIASDELDDINSDLKSHWNRIKAAWREDGPAMQPDGDKDHYNDENRHLAL